MSELIMIFGFILSLFAMFGYVYAIIKHFIQPIEKILKDHEKQLDTHQSIHLGMFDRLDSVYGVIIQMLKLKQ